MSAASRPIIAIIGPTGAGKSTFIQALTGLEACQIGHSLRSETSSITTFPLQTSSGTRIWLADTPGFDDTTRTDFEVLEELVRWISAKSEPQTGQNGAGAEEEGHLVGVVYMHPINQVRLRGSSRRMLRVMKKVLGDEWCARVLLVSTFWNEVDGETGARRERELCDDEDGWKGFCDSGARTERLGRDYTRFKGLLESMVPSGRVEAGKISAMEGRTLVDLMAAMGMGNDSDDWAERVRKMQDEAGEKERQRAREAEAQRLALEKEQAEKVELELQRQRQEAARVQERLEQQRIRNEREMELKRKELEEERQREAQLRARLEQQRVEAKKRARTQAIEEMERDAAVHCQSSRIQERRVGAVIDALRVLLRSGGYPQVLWGIKPRGRGIMGEGPQGQLLPDHVSVERNGMSIWCDYCRMPVGKEVSYVCFPCDMRICAACRRLERGCVNRGHILVEDEYWVYRGAQSNCRRVQEPGLRLWCDNTWCQKPIGGFYLHCCCGGKEMDFCETCILSRRARCCDFRHHLFWGVQPLAMLSLSSSTSSDMGLKYPQKTITVPSHTMQTWLNSSTYMLPLCRSVARYSAYLKQRTKLLDAQANGDITIGLQINLAYCDFCLSPVETKGYYTCQGEHPETGYTSANLSVCQPCYGRGIRCPGLHAMTYTGPVARTCHRDISPPVVLDCDACRRKMMQEVYFHCCRENDDFDLCVECVLQGWMCRNVTGDHVLRLAHLVPC